MWWLAWVLILATRGESKHCSIQENGFLAHDNGQVTWSTPIHLNLIEDQLNSLHNEIGYKQKNLDTHEVTLDGKAFTFSIPIEKRNSITLSRGKCIELKAQSASLENILKSRLNEKYRSLTSISFLMKTEGGVKCNINGKESETGCWKQVETMGQKYNLKTNTSNMKQFLETHELGLLSTRGTELTLTNGIRSRLPCITSKTIGKLESKWSLLKENYLVPLAERTRKILNRIKKTMAGRSKRSLFSSIFGLASAAETETIREALKIELNNQKETNKAMSNLLRNQIKTAKQISKENKILYKLETEELKLEEEVDSLKSFLEKAFSNSTEISTRIKQDVLAMLKAFTLSQRLMNIEEQLSTILDILHCPAGRCKRILEEVMEQKNIGEKDTLNLIADMATTRYNKDRIEVVMNNITKQDRIINLKCIPFLNDNNKTLRLKYNQELAVNKKGFYTLPPNCIRTIGVTLCPDQKIYSKDKCLKSLVDTGTTNRHCTNNFIQDTQTIQDFISDETTLNIYSRFEDKVMITSQAFQERANLNAGTNTFELKKTEYEIETSYMLFKVGRNKNKQMTGETITLTKYDPNQEDNITEQSDMKLNIDELIQIVIPRLSIDKDLNKFDLQKTVIPNPTLVFLSTPRESWYVYLILVIVIMTLILGITIYCKCRDKACFKTKHRNRVPKESKSKTKESESEEQTNLMEQTLKYCEMVLQNLGFCKEIVTTQKGKKYFWSGSSWRNSRNKLEPSYRDPPSYLLGELKPYTGGCMVSINKENTPYIHMKNFPDTSYNMALRCWEITEEGERRTLPSYAAPRPTEETLQTVRKTLIEHKNSSTNL